MRRTVGPLLKYFLMFWVLHNVGLGMFLCFNKEAYKNHSFSFNSTLSTHAELGQNKPAHLKHTKNEERILKSHFDDSTLFRHRQLVLLASKLHFKRSNLINYDLYLENVLSPQVSRSLY